MSKYIILKKTSKVGKIVGFIEKTQVGKTGSPTLVPTLVSAVKGYSSALNSVLALKGRDLAASREITMLLRSFSRSVDPVGLRPPAWDVSLVLQSLTGAPYEPLLTCEERFFWHRKLSFCWPLPRLGVSENSTLCCIVSLIPGAGVRYPFLLSRASWQRLRIPLPCSSV